MFEAHSEKGLFTFYYETLNPVQPPHPTQRPSLPQKEAIKGPTLRKPDPSRHITASMGNMVKRQSQPAPTLLPLSSLSPTHFNIDPSINVLKSSLGHHPKPAILNRPTLKHTQSKQVSTNSHTLLHSSILNESISSRQLPHSKPKKKKQKHKNIPSKTDKQNHEPFSLPSLNEVTRKLRRSSRPTNPPVKRRQPFILQEIMASRNSRPNYTTVLNVGYLNDSDQDLKWQQKKSEFLKLIASNTRCNTQTASTSR